MTPKNTETIQDTVKVIKYNNEYYMPSNIRSTDTKFECFIYGKGWQTFPVSKIEEIPNINPTNISMYKIKDLLIFINGFGLKNLKEYDEKYGLNIIKSQFKIRENDVVYNITNAILNAFSFYEYDYIFFNYLKEGYAMADKIIKDYIGMEIAEKRKEGLIENIDDEMNTIKFLNNFYYPEKIFNHDYFSGICFHIMNLGDNQCTFEKVIEKLYDAKINLANKEVSAETSLKDMPLKEISLKGKCKALGYDKVELFLSYNTYLENMIKDINKNKSKNGNKDIEEKKTEDGKDTSSEGKSKPMPLQGRLKIKM